MPNIRDYLMPAPGLYYLQYDYYYTSDTLKDRDGHRVDSIQGRSGGRSAAAPAWVGDFDVLGGHGGAYLICRSRAWA